MKRQWQIDELEAQFTLFPAELGLLGGDAAHNQLGKAVLLKYFQHEGCFPTEAKDVPEDVVVHIAQQLGFDASELEKYNWSVGRIKDHRQDIREWLGFRPSTVADQRNLRDWLQAEVIPHEHRPSHLEQLVRRRLKQLHIEPPSPGRLQQRVINSALHRYAKQFFANTFSRLPEETKFNLNQLIRLDVSLPEEAGDEADDNEKYLLHELKADSRDAKVKHIKRTAQRLKALQRDWVARRPVCRDTALLSANLSATSCGFLYQPSEAAGQRSPPERHIISLCWPLFAGCDSGK